MNGVNYVARVPNAADFAAANGGVPLCVNSLTGDLYVMLTGVTPYNAIYRVAGTTSPTTVTGATATVAATDTAIIANRAGTVTLTLPAAASYPGRVLRVKTIQAQTVVSASSDVVPLIGGAAGTGILAATAGKWATLQSNGTAWEIMAAN